MLEQRPSRRPVAAQALVPSSVSGRASSLHSNLPGGLRRQRSTTVTRASGAVSAVESPSSAASTSSSPSSGSLNVVVTGSTKGIGLALAKAFLAEGDRVVICSRDNGRVEETVSTLEKEYGKDRVVGTPCDVADGKSVVALADFAREKFGDIDIWINNAGSNAYSYKPLLNADDSDIKSIVDTNILGTLLCCREAIRVMRDQKRRGHVFNMDGAGADGGPTPRFAAYGATKRGLAQLGKSLQAELKLLNIPNVFIHNLSPGMVTTELLMSGADTKQSKWFINALAEKPEDVAEFLVPRVRQVANSPSPSSQYIRFLTKPKAYAAIFNKILGKNKDRWVPEDD